MILYLRKKNDQESIGELVSLNEVIILLMFYENITERDIALLITRF